MISTPSILRAGAGALVLLGTSIGVGLSAESVGAPANVARAAPLRRPFAGYWAARRAACQDPDSDDRMAIQQDTIRWYETRCRIRSVAVLGGAAWRLDLACRGEGQRIAARARVSLPTIDTLIVDDGPIGPSRRQRYIRCTR